MGTNKRLNLIPLLVLILFMTVFATGSVFACGDGDGDGDGESDSDISSSIAAPAQEQLVFDSVNTESVDPTPITIEIDGDGPTEIDRAATISNMTAIVEFLPWVGGAAVTIATAELSIPAGVVIGVIYTYSTSKLSGGSEDETNSAVGISALAGCFPGGPAIQILVSEALTALANTPISYGNGMSYVPAMAPTEVNPYTGQVLHR